MNRQNLIDTASTVINFDREVDYGKAEDNFQRIAEMWTAYTGTYLTPVDVGMMMILLKVARARHDKTVGDNYVDIIGYAALAGELAVMPESTLP